MTLKEHHFPYLPERLYRLGDLAYNLWFSWHTHAVRLFKSMDRKLWEDVMHNPVRMLHEIDPQQLEELSKDQEFLTQYDDILTQFDHYMAGEDTWYKHQYGDKLNKKIAYFSMEFGIHESLPIYSGGLGILAGDHLKSASDLGLPLVAIGLLYRESYFTQFISMHGHQQAIYIHNDFSNMALSPVMDDQGDALTLCVKLDEREVAIRIWEARIGRVQLYLLDTDFPENNSDDRDIMQRLYIGDRDMRLIQEILLGVGGVRALRAIGENISVWHMNEGHCSFSAFERLREWISKGDDYNTAISKIKSQTLFTTHTPIEAGNEVFDVDRVEHFLKPIREAAGLDENQLKKMAQADHPQNANAFNMTILSLNTSDYANGVSQLHGQVARNMWQSIFPVNSVEDVPIGSITNGVHSRTWITGEMKDLFDSNFGIGWRYKFTYTDFWEKVDDIPDEDLWKVRQMLKKRLRHDIRCRLVDQLERNGESTEAIKEAKYRLDNKALTIGFARRFAPYKRGTLLLRNRDWLKAILLNAERPVQIIFAGKAHPSNQPGKALIKEIYDESRNPGFGHRIIFVENYDMAFARRLVSGVDIWLNTPRRPLEASGTSGMKAAANGGLNLSILDGWWREAFNGQNGWAIGEDREYYNEWEQDEADSKSLYHLLEHEIAPLFFNRDSNGLPVKWLERVKNSMKTVIPAFNSDRMVAEYMTKYYAKCMEANLKK